MYVCLIPVPSKRLFPFDGIEDIILVFTQGCCECFRLGVQLADFAVTQMDLAVYRLVDRALFRMEKIEGHDC